MRVIDNMFMRALQNKLGIFIHNPQNKKAIMYNSISCLVRKEMLIDEECFLPEQSGDFRLISPKKLL